MGSPGSGGELLGPDLDSDSSGLATRATEAAGATRRLGFEFEGRARLTSWLFFDLDLTVNDARFTQNAGNANAVALAPRITVASGLSVLTPFRLRGSLRFTGVAARPATEDGFLVAQGRTCWMPSSAIAIAPSRSGCPSKTPTNAALSVGAVRHHFMRLRDEAPNTAPPPAGPARRAPRADQRRGKLRRL